ncbi:MAG: hypothetical protein JXB88_14260 [Spirochaetales bacterium]|nr:hypothetical protein [Spirochaetales bacterium]
MKSIIRLLSRYKYIILLIYFLALIIYILSPVFHEGNICSTDFVSNLMRARFMNENLIHHLSLDRWTYMQYLGFQPFMFYFPGFFILINLIHLLSFGLIPLVVAYKVLILASFLFLPVSVYFCMRSFNFRKIHAFFAALFSLTSGTIYGYGFKNLLIWGMDVSFFVISLLPAILALYHRLIKRNTLPLCTLLGVSLLFAAIAITHLQTTLHFILVLLFYNIYIFHQIKNKLLYFKKNLIILIITCLLAGFWYFPVLRYYNFFGMLSTCETDTLLNRTMEFLAGKYLTIRSMVILFVIGLFLLTLKSRKNRFLSFFPVTSLVIFIVAADYFELGAAGEFIQYLLNFFTTRSYATFCLFLSFIAGFALGEIILCIREGRYFLFSWLRVRYGKTGLIDKVNTAVTWLSRIALFILCISLITVSFNYMLSYRDDICTESDTPQKLKPRLIMGVFNWLKDNAGAYDLIGQQYQNEPIPEMSGAGYLVSLQDHTGLPIFGGGHFEASNISLTMGKYDNVDFFKQSNAEIIHQSLAKFNMKYIVIDKRQRFLDKLVRYKEGFEQVYTNAIFSILKIKGSNTIFLSEPEKNGFRVLDYSINLEKSVPELSWTINNTIPGAIMTVSLTYFPKWKAYIDGKQIKTLKNNDFLLIIPLEKMGVQTVTIKYEGTFPEMIFNLLSILILLFIIVVYIRVVIIKRKELALFKRSYWESRFSKTALMKKVILFTVTVVGCAVIFLLLGTGFGTLPPITEGSEESGLVNTTWEFYYMEENTKIIIAENLKLLPNRKIDGYESVNEDHWALKNGVLVFYTNENMPSTRFTRVTKKGDKYIFEGKFLLTGKITHVLEQH